MKYSLKRRQTSMYLRHKVIRALMPRLPGNINWGQRRTWPGTAMVLTPGWLAAQENGNFLLVFIVAITLILVGIVAIGFLWQFYVRQQRSKEVETPTAPAPHSDPATALPSETDLSGPASAPPKATSASDEPESIAIPSTRDDNKAKTQPSPAYRQAQSSPAPPPTAGEPSTLPASGQRPGRIHWQIAGMTDRGLKRELNEDNLLMMEAEMTDASPYGLYLVADGMGGHQGGDIASQLIVDTVRQQFIEQPLGYETPFNEWLKSGVIAANEVVLNHQQELTQERKMGSTLVVALVTEGQAHIANVGDSRAYH